MANLDYFNQLGKVRAWKLLNEDALIQQLQERYDVNIPKIRSRNLKIRLIELCLQCQYGMCLLSYDELRQVIVDGVALPTAA